MTQGSQTSAPASGDGIGTTATREFTVRNEDTVGHLVPGMPMVAATPYMVTIAERTCHEIPKAFLEPGYITVGTRVVIDHLGASKVGARLVVEATLTKRERNRFTFNATIKDGERTVAAVEHTRTAVALQKLLASLG